MKQVLLGLFLATAGCNEKNRAPAAPLQKPAPLEPLVAERLTSDSGTSPDDATYTVKPFTYVGDPAPSDALRIQVTGETLVGTTLADLSTRLTPQSVVVVAFDADTWLAQTLPLLALLDDSGAQVWLQSPDVPSIAWPVKLRDEANFNTWLDEGVAGKLRIIQRADGFELQTNMGKLAGADPKGPTVPTRGGSLDLVTLQKGLDRVKQRFTAAPDVCFMPSYATAFHDATRAIAANWLSKESVVFAQACLVYPRPAVRDAGK